MAAYSHCYHHRGIPRFGRVYWNPRCWKVSTRLSACLPLKSNMSIVPTGPPEDCSGDLEVFSCNKTPRLKLSLIRTAKLWCANQGEIIVPNLDPHCFNLDQFFVCMLKHVDTHLTSLRYYITTNKSGESYCGHSVRVQPFSHSYHLKVLKHLICVWHECWM